MQWIPLEKVQANDYNPNSVATNEMRLLYTSIKEDGYTQPVVTFYDKELDKYIIVDGFHRHLTMKLNADIYELYQGLLPCVVIEKDINQRMASTVRHNRARGKHAVTGMSNMVMQMLLNGMSDDEVCNKIGLEADELIRLKHLTGFSKLFKDVEYKKSWKNDMMLKEELKYRKSNENTEH
jgi:ParB-like chromosome segregation protein Spo0J